MVDTTTPKDLAEKIEWVGFSCLSRSEQEAANESLAEVSAYLPRLLALALWKYFGKEAPESLLTRQSDSNLDKFERREQARAFVREIMADYEEETM